MGEGEADGDGGLSKVSWGFDGASVGGEGSDAESWVTCLKTRRMDKILGDGASSAVCGGERE